MLLKIALAQIEVVPGHPHLNTAVMLENIEKARRQQADLIVFPEMSVPGYLLGDTWEQQSFLRDCEAYGSRIIAASSGGPAVLFGNVAVDWDNNGDDGRPRKFNAFFVAQDGRLIGQDNFPFPFRIKTLHPNYREFEDTRHFFSLRKLAQEMGTPAEKLLQPVNITLAGKPVTLGCILCEDGWSDNYTVKPLHALHANGPVDLFINISNSPFTLGKNNRRHRVFSRQAAETGAPLIYLNNVGLQNNGKTVYTFDGNSTVYNGRGEIITACPPFTPSLEIMEIDPDNKGLTHPALTRSDDNTIESIYRSLNYGIKKFLDLIEMEKVVVGLSGGIDSALSAALYASILDKDKIILVNMPSRYNSETTKGLAARLAENLGALYTVMPIQDSVESTITQLQDTPITDLNTGRSFHLKVTSTVAENIQARDRSSRLLAGIAAAFGGGFTCNANKSEMTVGYTTLYGDEAGFLAALADLWKHQVYALAEYMNEEVFRQEIIPNKIITLPPSAELSLEQAVDEGKGDPIIYPYHDYLFRSFMEEWHRSTPEDILSWFIEGNLEEKIGCRQGLVKEIFPGPREFVADLERWWELYTGLGVAKRIQAPPVLAVSRRAYGFDHREAQNGPYYTARYRRLKDQALYGISG